MMTYKCEGCGESKKAHTSKVKLCRGCDGTKKDEWEMAQAVRAEKWALTHKCRTCGVGLTIDRYFKCHGCELPFLRETEDLFDACDDMGGNEQAPTPAAKRKYAGAVAKICRLCLVVKEPKDFTRNPGMKDGHLKDCKVCMKARAKRAKLKEAA